MNKENSLLVIQVNTGREIVLPLDESTKSMPLIHLARLISKKEGYSLNDIQFVNSPEYVLSKKKLGDDLALNHSSV